MRQCPNCGIWIAEEEDNRKLNVIAQKLIVVDSDPNGVLTLEEERWLVNVVREMTKRS